MPKLDFQIPQTHLELDDSMITTQEKVDIPDLDNPLSVERQHPSSPTKVSITTKSRDSRTEETEMKTN